MTTKNLSLYIVDDDPDDHIFLIEALTIINPSLQYSTALNGQEGLQKLRAKITSLPSLIFLDLHMPKINGKQFLIEMNKDPALKYIPVIIYSTSADTNEIQEMKRLGAKDYLVKQSDSQALQGQLRSILCNFLYN